MKNRVLAIICCAWVVLHGTAWAGSEQEVKGVAILNGQVVILTPGKTPVALTHDASAKSLPTWSNDGERIAFLENSVDESALSRLRIIDKSGLSVASFLIEPVIAGRRYVGMRFVDSVAWLNNSTVVVGGSINPSQSQYYLYHLTDAAAVQSFVDDQSSPGFSPDGLHYAYKTGIPHWARDASHPRLVVDGTAVFPQTGRAFNFVDGPYWSADSGSVAILAVDALTSTTRVVVWRSPGRIIIVPTHIDTSRSSSIFWNGTHLFVRGAQRGLPSDQSVWEVALDSTKLVSTSSTLAVPITADGLHLRDSLLLEFNSLPGVKQTDLWCMSCGLSLLPRRSPLND